MRRIRWEVVPASGLFRWVVTRAGMEQRRFWLKSRAVRYASSECVCEWEFYDLKAELYIKGRDGKIQDARTYGDDPKRTKG